MAIASLGGLGLLGLALIGIIMDATQSTGDRVVGIVSTVVTALVLIWLCYLGIWMMNAGRPAIRLEPDEMVIEHHSLFRRPVRIPRSSVAAMNVDVGTEGSLRPKDRFRIERRDHDPHEHLPTWLYSGKHGSPMPLIGHFREIPNVAILLREPFRFRGIRRVSRPVFRHSVRSPIRTKDVRGFMFAAEQPFLAEQTLRAWGVPMRAFDTLDAISLRPGPGDRRRQTYRTAFTMFVGLAVFGSQAAIAYLVTDGLAPQRCDNLRSSTAVRLSGGDSEPEVEVTDLSEVALDTPEGWIPSEGGEELDPDLLADLFGSDWADLLDSYEFERGYTREWSNGRYHLYENIWEFPSHDRAVSMQDELLASACPEAVDAFRVEGVKGSTGVAWEEGDRLVEAVYMARGPRLYVVALDERGEEPTRRQLERFTRLADDVAR
jgi:hypothetical protein